VRAFTGPLSDKRHRMLPMLQVPAPFVSFG